MANRIQVVYQEFCSCALMACSTDKQAVRLRDELRAHGFLVAPAGDKPNYVLARSPKGGPDELLRFLGTHPDVRVSKVATYGRAGCVLLLLFASTLGVVGVFARDPKGSFGVLVLLLGAFMCGMGGFLSLIFYAAFRSARPDRPLHPPGQAHGECDLCAKRTEQGSIVAQQIIVRGARAGLRPPGGDEVLAAGGISAKEWLKQLEADTANWLLCPMCLVHLEQHLLVPRVSS